MRTAQLRYFLRILELGSFRMAAEEMHLSQSALSESVKSLERDLGAQLMERDRSGVRLTPAGEDVIPYLRVMVEAEEALRVEVDGLKTLRRGHVRIGATCVGATAILPPALAEFSDRYPNIQVHVTEADSPSILKALKDGVIDLGLVVEPADSPIPHDDRFVYLPLLTTRVVAVLPVGHPLADQAAISPDDLASEPFILLGHGATTEPAQVMLDLSELNVVLYADSIDFSRRMVALGVGVTTLPELGVVGVVSGLEELLTSVPLKHERAILRFTLVQRRVSHPSHAVREMAGALLRRATSAVVDKDT